MALLVLAVMQVATPPLSFALGGGDFTTADRPGEPSIVPAGYTFSIWFVVEVLCLVYAVWALPAHRPGLAVRNALAKPLSAVFAGFSLWIVASDVEPVVLTLLVFAAMVFFLVRALDTAMAADLSDWPRWAGLLLWVTLGVYLGWSAVAIWMNVATTLAELGVPVTGTVGLLFQALVLAAATASAAYLLRRTRVLPGYAVAVTWAYVGVVAGAAGAGELVLAGLAAVGLVVLGAVAAFTLQTRKPPVEARI